MSLGPEDFNFRMGKSDLDAVIAYLFSVLSCCLEKQVLVDLLFKKFQLFPISTTHIDSPEMSLCLPNRKVNKLSKCSQIAADALPRYCLA